jgi:hypothetical protein
MFERRSKAPVEKPYHDSYFETFGVRMTLEDLIDIRELEDELIELEHITEDSRYPVPPYLVSEWADFSN